MNFSFSKKSKIKEKEKDKVKEKEEVSIFSKLITGDFDDGASDATSALAGESQLSCSIAGESELERESIKSQYSKTSKLDELLHKKI